MTSMELSKAIQQQIEEYKEQQNRLEDIINCLNSSKEALDMQRQITETTSSEGGIEKNTITLFNPNPPKTKPKMKEAIIGAIGQIGNEHFKLKTLKDFILYTKKVGTPSSFNTCFHQMMRDGELKGVIKPVRGKRGMYRKVAVK